MPLRYYNTKEVTEVFIKSIETNGLEYTLIELQKAIPLDNLNFEKIFQVRMDLSKIDDLNELSFNRITEKQIVGNIILILRDIRNESSRVEFNSTPFLKKNLPLFAIEKLLTFLAFFPVVILGLSFFFGLNDSSKKTVKTGQIIDFPIVENDPSHSDESEKFKYSIWLESVLSLDSALLLQRKYPARKIEIIKHNSYFLVIQTNAKSKSEMTKYIRKLQKKKYSWQNAKDFIIQNYCDRIFWKKEGYFICEEK